MNYFRKLWEKFKAWRRDEVLVSTASKGRLFMRKGELSSSQLEPTDGAKRATGKATLQLVQVKVIRADGTEEIKNG